VLKIDGQDAYGHYQLGRLLLQQENLSEAAAHLEESVRIQPAIPEAHAELGSLYKRQNRIGEAKKAYRTAVRLNPKLIKACYGLAQLLRAEGQVEEAKRFFDEVQQSKQNRSESEPASALNVQGVDQMNEGHLDEAQTAFKKALTMDPSLALAAYNLGLVLTRQSKTQAAIEAFRTAVRLRPGFALAHYDLGILLKVAGDPAASEELRKAQLLHKLVPQVSTVSRATSPEDPD
jgi:tetratricopeptide (TPR) repeat protein